MRKHLRKATIGVTAAVALGATATLATANDAATRGAAASDAVALRANDRAHGLAVGQHTIDLEVGQVVLLVASDGAIDHFGAPAGWELVPGSLEVDGVLRFVLQSSTDQARQLTVSLVIDRDGTLSVDGAVTPGTVPGTSDDDLAAEPSVDDDDEAATDQVSAASQDSSASQDSASGDSPPSADSSASEDSASADSPASADSSASEDSISEDSPASEDSISEDSPVSEPSVDD